jgi:hypothetical protein
MRGGVTEKFQKADWEHYVMELLCDILNSYRFFPTDSMKY